MGTRGEGIGLCGKHLQELFTVYLTRFRIYKIALPLKQKTEKGRVPHTDIYLPPSPFTGQFLGLESISYLVHDDTSCLEVATLPSSKVRCNFPLE